MTVTRVIETERDRTFLYRLIAAQKKLPFTVSIDKGKRRSVEQNKLQRLWMKEAAEQLQDRSAEEVRGECKLMFGVPILRSENEAFRDAYDTHVKGLPYPTKLAMMMEPLDFPVTRLMTTRQKKAYLDAVQQHFLEQGVVLTDPERQEEHA